MNLEIFGEKGKKVIVYGLKVTGVSASYVFSNLGIPVMYYCDNLEKERDQEEAVKKYDNVNNLADINDVDWKDVSFLLKSPGISLDKSLIVAAKEHGIPVYSDIEVAYQIFGGDKIIAITGSNGKTTTVSLVAHLLKEAGMKVVAVGNIGNPVLTEMYDHRDDQDYYYVLECSSFQLASVEKFKPHIAAILNITEDHMEWHGTMEDYTRCKLAIAKNQDYNDAVFIYAKSNALKQAENQGRFKAKINEIDPKNNELSLFLNDSNNWKLLGKHNIVNALFGYEICKSIGVDKETLEKGLKSFRAIEHRMEFIRDFNGVSYVNDSKATNVDAAVVALSSLNQPIWLLAGGYDKHADYSDLYPAFSKNGKMMILYGLTKNDIAKGAIEYGLKDKIVMKENLEQALLYAKENAVKGDMVLLSPACASWDQYSCFEDRGDEFRDIVNNF